MFNLSSNHKRKLLYIESKLPEDIIKNILKINSINSINNIRYFIVENKYNLTSDISLEKSILIDIKISTRVPSLIPKKIDEDKDKEIIIEKLIDIHNNVIREDLEFTMTLTKRQRILTYHMSGLWGGFYGKYMSLTQISESLFSANINNRTVIINKDNGKFKANNNINNFVIFLRKYFKFNTRDIWNKLEDYLEYLPKIKDNEITMQNNCYYYLSEKGPIQLTNWTGIIKDNLEAEEHNLGLSWILKIGPKEIVIEPEDLIDKKDFQSKIIREGMYFYYGDNHQLKKMVEFLSYKTIRQKNIMQGTFWEI